MINESKVTIKIPRPLYRRLQAIVDGSGFDSVTDFIVYILRDIASGADAAARLAPEDRDKSQLTEEEIVKVRERLRKLGYL